MSLINSTNHELSKFILNIKLICDEKKKEVIFSHQFLVRNTLFNMKNLWKDLFLLY